MKLQEIRFDSIPAGYVMQVSPVTWSIFNLAKRPLENPWPTVAKSLDEAVQVLHSYHAFINCEEDIDA